VDKRAPEAVDLGHHDALGVAALRRERPPAEERTVAAGARLVEPLEDLAEQIAAGPDHPSIWSRLTAVLLRRSPARAATCETRT
jgi:hypothetical protein